MGRLFPSALLMAAVVTACAKQPSTPAQSAQDAQSSTASSTPVGPAGTDAVTGTVRETMDAASYTYVRVSTDKGDVWAAAPQVAVKVGERVVVPLEMPMQNFHSQSLNRDFPLIYFVSQIRREGESAATASGGAPSMMPAHGTSTPNPAEQMDPMAAPAGGLTIADVWSKRQSLAGKPVTVHGKVVKFNGGIMGKNWFHLQDGTGKASDGTHDLTVTTPEDVVVKVGDTVTVTGTVAIDKDFGAGYAYGAILENARVTPKS